MRIVWLLALVALATPAFAQENHLVVEDLEIVSGVGDFGQPIVSAVGTVSNTSADQAYTNINLHATALDANDEQIGEGFGVLGNACGVGLLPDFTLQPGDSQGFNAPLEMFAGDATVARVVVSAEAAVTEPTLAEPLADGITRVTNAETVTVEWIDESSFRFATGCETDLFIDWAWYHYDLASGEQTIIEPPHAEDVTETLRQRIELEDETIFRHSMLRYAPDGDRLVYQNARNDFLTAYLDGTFRRGLYIGLHNFSLQDIYWQPDERFIASYYGAYGDPVNYFVADAEARALSPALPQNPPSITAPGLSRDGRRVVVSGEFEEGTGYYLYVVTNGFFEKLFDAELERIPGNNYPAPIPVAEGEDDLIARVYLTMPVEGKARLQCYNREEAALHDLAPLPLQLANSERAWWWLSPDDTTIALAADGVHGGLWLIDLAALPECGAEAEVTPEATPAVEVTSEAS